MKPYAAPLQTGVARLQDATMWLAQNSLQSPDNAGAASVDYLRMFVIVVVGYLWARQAKAALSKLAAKSGNAAFHEAKLVGARFWMERLMPDTASLGERVRPGRRADDARRGEFLTVPSPARRQIQSEPSRHHIGKIPPNFPSHGATCHHI